MPSPIVTPMLSFLARLRYPQLFKITAALFLIDLVVPDMVPFIDELLLGLATLLLANWKRRREPAPIEPAR